MDVYKIRKECEKRHIKEFKKKWIFKHCIGCPYLGDELERICEAKEAFYSDAYPIYWLLEYAELWEIWEENE